MTDHTDTTEETTTPTEQPTVNTTEPSAIDETLTGNETSEDNEERVLAWVEIVSRPDYYNEDGVEPTGTVTLILPSSTGGEKPVPVKYYRRLDTDDYQMGMHIPVYVDARENPDPRTPRYELRNIIVITLNPEDEVTVAMGDPNHPDTWVFGAVFHGCRLADIDGFADLENSENNYDHTTSEEDEQYDTSEYNEQNLTHETAPEQSPAGLEKTVDHTHPLPAGPTNGTTILTRRETDDEASQEYWTGEKQGDDTNNSEVNLEKKNPPPLTAPTH